ncbi:MAG: type I-U CRISPR-associated protein Cas7 [Phycisphaeraceae bacterium]|nr:type I-U CRISPR-associated protein Cas7 [Phycisphaeraceae bacterium]
MSDDLKRFDIWLDGHNGPAALVIREPLIPAEGADGIVFPATFAPAEDRAKFAGGYNIDSAADGTNICLIDSVGSQANRLEPLFAQAKYAGLVPQIAIKAGEKTVTIFEAGHRAGDAIVRCTELQKELHDAFKAILRGDAEPMAKLGPTSLVFGVWDSRDTQAKLPRLVASTIRAYDVKRLTRSAQFNPSLNYAELEVFSEEDKVKAEGDSKNPLAKRGFIHIPASGCPGGVIATGGIRRDATLSLAALRLLATDNEQATLTLRRYILGLALVAFTAPTSSFLRQGCLLVANPDKPCEFVEVYADGKRVPCAITHDQALAYAQEAAKAFGVGPSRTVNFDKDRAKKDVQGEGETKGKRGVKKAEAVVPAETN